MSKLRALLQEPIKPNEHFHSLENITPRNKMAESAPWDLIKQLLNHTDINMRILGVYLNAVLTENKTTHLLSGKLLSKLLGNQSLIDRKTLTNKHAASLILKFQELGIIEILRPVIEGKKSAVVSVVDLDICNYVNIRIGQELSDSYKASVLSFYDSSIPSSTKEFHYKVPLESSTTTTITNTDTENQDVDVLKEDRTAEPLAIASVLETPATQTNPEKEDSTANPHSAAPLFSNPFKRNAEKKAALLPSPALTETNAATGQPEPAIINPEHRATLTAAQSIPMQSLNAFEQSFLIGKEDALKKYGSFLPKQIEILKSIIKKAPKTPITRELVKINVNIAKTVQELYSLLSEHSYKSAEEVFKLCMYTSLNLNYKFSNEDLTNLAGLLNVTVTDDLKGSIRYCSAPRKTAEEAC